MLHVFLGGSTLIFFGYYSNTVCLACKEKSTLSSVMWRVVLYIHRFCTYLNDFTVMLSLKKYKLQIIEYLDSLNIVVEMHFIH